MAAQGGANATAFQLIVKNVTGEEVLLDVSSTSTLLQVKGLIEAKTGVSVARQRYVLAGRTLEDGRELRDYNVDQMKKPLVFLLVRKQPAKPMDLDDFEATDRNGAPSKDAIVQAAADARARFQKLQNELKAKKGFYVQPIDGDGNCMFRAVALQVWGDQDEHAQVRQSCMDHMEACRSYYQDFIDGEGFSEYIARKRQDRVHGNNPELQAISEIYNRPVEVYVDGAEPSNTLDPGGADRNPPLRLSYHENCHYNAVMDPENPTVGVGVLSCLSDFEPGLARRQQDAQIDVMTTEDQLTQQVVEASRAQYDADLEKVIAMSTEDQIADDFLEADMDEVLARSRAEAGLMDEQSELQRAIAESQKNAPVWDEEEMLRQATMASLMQH